MLHNSFSRHGDKFHDMEHVSRSIFQRTMEHWIYLLFH